MRRRSSTIDAATRRRWIAWLNRPVLPPSGAQLDMFDESFRAEKDSAREKPRHEENVPRQQ